jgi:hypothetical protein
MMHAVRFWVMTIAVVSLAGCVAGYTLVPASTTKVAKASMIVTPSMSWNKNGFVRGIAQEEYWTQNGPLLDAIRFVGALPAGQAITKQKPKDDRKVPVFRQDMTPQDLVSMIESYYRIEGGATTYEATNVSPRVFLGTTGTQVDYQFVTADEVKRRGRAILAIVNQKLYLISLSATSLHYYDSLLAEFDTIVSSARI